MGGTKKIEKLITKLRRDPENKKCADCATTTQFGFNHICVKYMIFVCPKCKSAHQAYSHRVKDTMMSTFTMEEVKAMATENGGGNKNNRRLWYGKLSDSQFSQKLPAADASMSQIKNWINVVYERKGYYLKGGRKTKAKTKSPAKAATRKAKRPSSKAKAKASAARKAPAPAEDLMDFGTDSWADPFGDDASSSATAPTPPPATDDFFGGDNDFVGAGAPSSDLMGGDLLGGDVTTSKTTSSSTNSGGFGAAELSNLFGSSMAMGTQPQASSLNSSSMFGSQMPPQVQQPVANKGALISSLGMRRVPQRQMMPRKGPHLLQGMGQAGMAQPQGFPQQQPRMQPRIPQQSMRPSGMSGMRPSGMSGMRPSGMSAMRPSGMSAMRPSGMSGQQRQTGMGSYSMRPLAPQPAPQKTGPPSSAAVASQPIRVGSGMRGPGPMRPMMNNVGLDALDPFAQGF